MAAIRLTSKRQATLPRDLCEEMHVGPGDTLLVEKRVVDGEALWCLRPAQQPDWFGCLSAYAEGKPHDMQAIRASIERARRDGEL